MKQKIKDFLILSAWLIGFFILIALSLVKCAADLGFRWWL